MKRLEQHLTSNFNPVEVADIDAVVEFALTDTNEHLRVEVASGRCTLSSRKATWTIYLSNEDTALELLHGRSNPIDLFMQKQLSSSGYIVSTFRILRAFMVAD